MALQFRHLPIQRKLMIVIMVTSGVVLLLTCAAFLGYEMVTFRQNAVRQMSTLGEIIATNSTAVLAFDNPEDAAEVLGALRADRHIVAAALYNKQGRLFASYSAEGREAEFPASIQPDGYRVEGDYMVGFTPVVQVKGATRLGTLYLRSDRKALTERLRLYGGIAGLVVLALSIVAYALSRKLQQQISGPILALAETAQAVSRRDYSVRALPQGDDEIGLLTEAFNHMLEQIEAKNAELEARVHERTMELEAANKELEAFAYSVSHDLRTPLRAITGFAEILLKRPADTLAPEARRCVELIQRGAGELDQLINNILAFSRLGHQALDCHPVDLAALSREVYEELRAALGARRVDFRVQALPQVSATPQLLRQVMINLIDNALKFTRSREQAVIEVGVRWQKAGAEPTFYIRDNGVGFDMNHADKLFGVFQRLHSAQAFEGTGVGLAMVRRIIERHGGRVWAEAVPDAGATIYFTLPEVEQLG